MKKKALYYALIASSLLVAGCSKNEKRTTPLESDESILGDQTEGLRSFPTFNPKTLVTFQGQIASVTTMNTPGNDVLLIVRTDEGDIPVQLGPEYYVAGGPVELSVLDEVEITGSKLFFQGRILIIAREISTDRYSLKLRDSDGNPLWSAWKRK